MDNLLEIYNKDMVYDTVIIGGGPAAVAAGVYAARKQMKTVFIADQIGGQSVVSDGIENWIGDKVIPGAELAKKLKDHLENYKEQIEIKIPLRADSVSKNDDGTFDVVTAEETFTTKTVIVTSGGRHRKLGVPGEEEFNAKGVAYCATCDAPFFGGKDVVVVGGGNSGLESVMDLLPYAAKVYLLARKNELKGDPVTQSQVLASDKVEVIYGANTKEIHGEMMVTGLTYEDLATGDEKKLDVQGVFVEIGAVPNSEFVSHLVDTNDYNEVVINHRSAETSCPGIFAAGDVTDELYKQNNIAVGDAIIAALSAYEYVRKNS